MSFRATYLAQIEWDKRYNIIKEIVSRHKPLDFLNLNDGSAPDVSSNDGIYLEYSLSPGNNTIDITSIPYNFNGISVVKTWNKLHVLAIENSSAYDVDIGRSGLSNPLTIVSTENPVPAAGIFLFESHAGLTINSSCKNLRLVNPHNDFIIVKILAIGNEA